MSDIAYDFSFSNTRLLYLSLLREDKVLESGKYKDADYVMSKGEKLIRGFTVYDRRVKNKLSL
jgi:hypothetical protein